jgi:hypothetical protein
MPSALMKKSRKNIRDGSSHKYDHQNKAHDELQEPA